MRRRFTRLIFTTVSALSLLLCLGTCLLWDRSYGTADLVERTRLVSDGGATKFFERSGVFSSVGAIGVGHVRVDLPTLEPLPGDERWHWTQDHDPRPVAWNWKWAWLGFRRWDVFLARDTSHQGGGRVDGFQFPHWFAAMLFGMPPAVWLFFAALRWRNRKRARSGHCVACGYDLRASVDRCPECGVTVAPAA